MKKIRLHFVLLFAAILLCSDLHAQSITGVVVPQYIQGLNGTNNNRVPFVYRAQLSGLSANTTYRFINQVVTSSDAPTTNGAGNCIYVNPDNSFTRTTSTGFVTPGQYGEFTTDASGSFTGWFITETTGNSRFKPGNYIYMRIRLNDGAGGTTAVTYLTIPDSVRVLNFYTTSGDTSCTAIFGSSLADPKDFVFLYDNALGTGRPISSAIVESDGVDLSSVTSIAQFYRDSVDSKNGFWGSIIPNLLPNGVRRIERRLLSDGSIHHVVATDDDGIWPSGANTVNPTGGLNPIRIQTFEAPLPVELISFSASIVKNSVRLTWKTATEVNNLGFEVQRKHLTRTLSEGENSLNWEKIGFVNGRGTSSSLNEYSFFDNNVSYEKYFYRLKQIDADGSFTYSSIIDVDFNQPNQFRLEQNYPNPFNPSTSISYQIAGDDLVTLKIFNALGNEVATLVNEDQTAGNYSINFSADELQLSSGTYFYQLRTGNFLSVKKMLLLK